MTLVKFPGCVEEAAPTKQPPKAEQTGKLFMKAKEFALATGAPYNRVLEWIAKGLPIMPEGRNPYYVIVPAAIEWLKNKYNF
jgi:hypothetical protein